MIERIVQSVMVGPDGGLQIQFYTPEADVKANGVIQLHTLIVPAEDDYDDEIEEIVSKIKFLITDVLEDMPNLPAGTPE